MALTLATSSGCKEFLRRDLGGEKKQVRSISFLAPPPLSLWRSGYFKDGIFGDARTCINNPLMPFHHKPFRVSGCLLKVLLFINNQKEHFLDSIDCYKQPLIWSIIHDAYCGQWFRNSELDINHRHCHLSSPSLCLESLWFCRLCSFCLLLMLDFHQ